MISPYMKSQLSDRLNQGKYEFQVRDCGFGLHTGQSDGQAYSKIFLGLSVRSMPYQLKSKFKAWECHIHGPISSVDKDSSGNVIQGIVEIVDEILIVSAGADHLALTAIISVIPQIKQHGASLYITTAQKLEDWDGIDWVTILEFSLGTNSPNFV